MPRNIAATSTRGFSDVSKNLLDKGIMSVLKVCGGKLLARALLQVLEKSKTGML